MCEWYALSIGTLICSNISRDQSFDAKVNEFLLVTLKQYLNLQPLPRTFRVSEGEAIHELSLFIVVHFRNPHPPSKNYEMFFISLAK